LVDIRALSASHADRANGQNGRSKRMSKLRSKRPSSDTKVREIAFRKGFIELACYLTENKIAYFRFILTGEE